MKTWKKQLSLIAAALLITVLAACGDSGEEESNDEQGEISIGQINWAENIAVTNMWKAILEDEGYDVELTNLDMGATMQALESSELDASLEIWLPVQDANYLEEYQDTVNFSDATWFDNAKVGLVVPEYVEEVNSIEDLNEHKEMFEGEIIGFDSGAGTMEVTEDLIEEYELEYELMPSSEPAMLTEIEKAVENEEPIVSPLWTPHSVFSKHELKFLEDPKEVYGGVEKIHHATRQEFADDYPEVSEWLKNWKMDDQQIGELIQSVDSAEEPLDGAKEWIDENQDVVDEWIQ
ncbi:glycine/betaine ABC transporter [Halalkalibacillus sediminis]|uniref:Glycine/betaine ABC transporter n=1 Tax=Halalkalibacillus sediminis TaxID=2018042 RepID=A0A2I0QQQ1_9BACI|nr:glycine betaine ABC transporter substrate-binding protein [Halalkalibacillus sediminis]PKR76657.1 glycine/betaine ABC transporter [Halalkalibacillus sediminis]